MLRLGMPSLSRMVPVAVPRRMAALLGLLKLTVNERVGWAVRLPSTSTLTDFEVSPGAKVSTPLAATMSWVPEEAEGLVPQATVTGRDDGAESVTAKVALLLPASPSVTEASAI